MPRAGPPGRGCDGECGPNPAALACQAEAMKRNSLNGLVGPTATKGESSGDRGGSGSRASLSSVRSSHPPPHTVVVRARLLPTLYAAVTWCRPWPWHWHWHWPRTRLLTTQVDSCRGRDKAMLRALCGQRKALGDLTVKGYRLTTVATDINHLSVSIAAERVPVSIVDRIKSVSWPADETRVRFPDRENFFLHFFCILSFCSVLRGASVAAACCTLLSFCIDTCSTAFEGEGRAIK